jgi:gamma-glutamyltranspeptidase/glutathione hydrolase
MGPPSSGGVGIIEMLNVLEGYDLKSLGFASAAEIHLMAPSSCGRRSLEDFYLNRAPPAPCAGR